MEDRAQLWNGFAAQIAVDSLRATTAAGSGHPTSSMSCAHLLAVLFADHLRFDVKDPDYPLNDRFILSKGHAAPGLYATLKGIAAFGDDELLTLRKQGSPLQGHPAPIPELPWVDVATGSLGQGLAIGLGMALSMRLDGSDARVWVLLGDSEMAEGSVWEAMEAIAFHGASNVTAILDLNRLGQRGPTMHGWAGDVFRRRAEAFGWNAAEIDGHDVAQIDHAYRDAIADDHPTFIVARTEKGHGVSFLANQEGLARQGRASRSARRCDRSARRAERPPRHAAVSPGVPADGGRSGRGVGGCARVRRTDRDAQGVRRHARLARRSLARPGRPRRRGRQLDLHGRGRGRAPERFVELYIAEGCMLGTATGLQALGKTAFAATFGAFWTRAADQSGWARSAARSPALRIARRDLDR
jgi:Transketolase, N-terminal subunit